MGFLADSSKQGYMCITVKLQTNTQPALVISSTVNMVIGDKHAYPTCLITVLSCSSDTEQKSRVQVPAI